jgi:small-conductance mechanosensitive channel
MLFSVLMNMFPTAKDLLSHLEGHSPTQLSLLPQKDLKEMKDKAWDMAGEVGFWSFITFLVAMFMGAMAVEDAPLLFLMCGVFLIVSYVSFMKLARPLGKQTLRIRAELKRQEADLAPPSPSRG